MSVTAHFVRRARSALSVMTDFLVQNIAENRQFRSFARFLNERFSPRRDICVRVNAHSMYANTLDRILALYLWKFSALEGFETELLKETLQEGSVVYDVGANIGYYSLIFADIVGSSGKVYAFEPDPDNYRLLCRNIEANGYDNIVPVEMAVSNKKESINFFVSKENRGDHRIYDPKDVRSVISVQATTLDQFAADQEPPNLIKMDIQGSEYLAVCGMERLVRQHKDLVVICEFWPYALQKGGTPPGAFLEKLQSLGFMILNIDERNRRIEHVDTRLLLNRYDGYKYTNLFLRIGT